VIGGRYVALLDELRALKNRKNGETVSPLATP